MIISDKTLIKKYRSEWKYLEHNSLLMQIKERISGVLDLDTHSSEDGHYSIHSLYFDDLYNTCTKENEAGDRIRYKYRIRYYGNNTDYITLERKEKYNGYCYKKSCKLTRDEYIHLVDGDCSEIIWNTDKEVLREFALAIMTRGFGPKVIIDYERAAFVEPISNIRITFDQCISASDEIDLFLDGNYHTHPIVDSDRGVLEVKFDDILPTYVYRMITNSSLTQQAFSKYYLGRKAIQDVYNY